jgi:uncharacterized membrane protein
MLLKIFFLFHIAMGVSGLILGPVAMSAEKAPGRHTRMGEIYHWVVLAICLTSAVIAFLDWERRKWFLVVSALSYAFALMGYLAVKRRKPGWVHIHLSGMCASYAGLWTAVLLVEWENFFGSPGVESPIAWLLPAIIAAPIIVRVNRKAARDGVGR